MPKPLATLGHQLYIWLMESRGGTIEDSSEKTAVPARHTKVLKLHILKPAGVMTWKELGKLLRDARYRVFRLANLVVSEAYVAFHQQRSGNTQVRRYPKVSQLNVHLREMLESEAAKREKGDPNLNRFSKVGALPATVTDSLSLNKLGGSTRWSEILRGKSSLPTFRLNMAIPIRCDKPRQKRLARAANGDVEVDLMVCNGPYPRVVIATARNSLSDSHKAILERLLDNPKNLPDGYRHRCFEVKEDERSGKWHLFVTYDFPATAVDLSSERIVGVDLGFSCPLYAAINNGHGRLGRRHFAALSHRIRVLQNRVMNTRREIQRGGKSDISQDTSRSGHGRQRKLDAIGRLDGMIDRAYTTLNHQLSAAVIKFAKDNGAAVIQVENLKGLQQELTGSFLGERWRREELQRFIAYKAKEAGIEVREVNPRYTSRRCSECGHIHVKFSRAFRDRQARRGNSTRFECPTCGYKADADYNAARNLATIDIEDRIADAAKKQGIS